MAALPPKLPSDYPTWQDAATANGLTGKTVHTAELASASKMDYSQFLLLHSLWDVHLGEQNFKLPKVVEPYLKQAIDLLAQYQCWESFCKGIEDMKNPRGSFSIARHYQTKATKSGEKMRPDSFDTPIAKRTRGQANRKLEEELRKLRVDETPSKNPNPPQAPETPNPAETPGDDSVVLETPQPPETPVTPAALVPEDLQRQMFPPTEDENIVNFALLAFLTALTIHFSEIELCEWSIDRKALVAHFEEAKYESRVDGCLKDCYGNLWALIEVKPVTRAYLNQVRIQIQEGAEMVNKIKNDIDAPLDRLRVLVSQDRHEIFITIAEYGSDYISYLKAKPAENEAPAFLTMHQYGPWDTRNAGHMKRLGPILLAITLYAEAEAKKAKPSSPFG